MKKVLPGKIVFLAFSFFIILLQTGCKKSSLEDMAFTKEPSYNGTRILYRISSDNNSINALWSVDARGSNKHKINIVLPAGWFLDNEDMAEVSSDGLTIVFVAYNAASNEKSIYKCNIDGSAVVRVTAPVTNAIGVQAMINKTTVLYWKELLIAGYNFELWSVNLDGTNDHHISVTLPEGLGFQEEELAKVTSNGLSIVFLAMSTVTGEESIYKCNIDGSNPVLITSEIRDYSLAIQSLTTDNTVLFSKTADDTPDELWSINLDGTNKHRINLALPADTELLYEEMAKGTRDEVLYFSTKNTISGKMGIYTSKIDGLGVKLITEDIADDLAIQSLY